MRDSNSPVLTPLRVKVFGSAVVRVAADSASIVIAVSRIEKEPKDAFANVRRGAQAVHACLQRAGIKDFGASRVSLSQEFRYTGGENRFIGYQAKIGYSIILRDLDRIEELLTALIDAGANELTSVTFQTTRLKEVRADARRRAVTAAREKAELYCTAAGVSIGRVVAIEDANPETLSGRHEGHVHQEPAADDPGELKAIDPGAITVGAAVNVVYEINDPMRHAPGEG
ncbi:MAG TPA: SIMPL domain-containing protein [Gemmataceae bacterium]|jgi:hypothetical protein|nr:SIMPL domain-containing protein [Gemmataceae bacterium]